MVLRRQNRAVSVLYTLETKNRGLDDFIESKFPIVQYLSMYRPVLPDLEFLRAADQPDRRSATHACMQPCMHAARTRQRARPSKLSKLGMPTQPGTGMVRTRIQQVPKCPSIIRILKVSSERRVKSEQAAGASIYLVLGLNRVLKGAKFSTARMSRFQMRFYVRFDVRYEIGI